MSTPYRGIEVRVVIMHAGVSHMEPAAQFTVERIDWDQPDPTQRTTVLGTFGRTERDLAHACCRAARG